MPTFTQTARYALRWLTGANVISDIDAGFQALAEDVDARMVGKTSGPESTLPTSSPASPGIVGREYYATDSKKWFKDNGTGWDEFTLGGAPASVPTATILAYGASTPPAGYLACDGSAVDRTTYANLFAVIGTAHGAGNGTSTFNVPDLRGRAAVGAGTGTGLTNRALGSKFGEETHQLSEAELAAHGHSIAINLAGAHGHSLSIGSAQVAATGNSLAIVSGGGSGGMPVSGGLDGVAAVTVSGGTWTGTVGSHSHSGSIGAVGDHSHAGSIGSTGNGQAHNNVQPSTAVAYIIKT